MNFLAHLYLSGNDEKVMVGNFIGDFVKGRQSMAHFEQAIIKGIELHRSIDEFTDSHTVVQQSKNRLRPKYRHYSGVIVDIFYDHFLARHWSDYHTMLLPDYADFCYGVIQKHQAVLPAEVQFMMPHMIRGNWLANYARLDGIQRALQGMSRRTSFDSKMDESIAELKEHYDLFYQEFAEFFDALRSHCGQWLLDHR
jgi:acyl carrier protein phosphodiesterase